MYKLKISVETWKKCDIEQIFLIISQKKKKNYG